MPRRHPERDPRATPRPLGDVKNIAGHQRRERATCTVKDRFESEAQARAFAVMHTPGRGPRSAPYQCAICDGWHLTSRG